MVQRNASDLLLKVGRPPTVRLNGELQGLEMPPVKPEDLKLLAEQIMTPRQVKEFVGEEGGGLRHRRARAWAASGPTSTSSAARSPSPSAPSPTR